MTQICRKLIAIDSNILAVLNFKLGVVLIERSENKARARARE